MTPLEEIAQIADVPVEIGIELDRRAMKLSEILNLEEGSVIRMRRAAGEAIDIFVGGRPVASGEIVMIVDATMGVRITDLATNR